ncbi:hypothetical protein EYR38_003034 [Pleurotus pulmonarius]|nr:hypothetical protein EYR38_003034 [Pleurotus pulmonarius]
MISAVYKRYRARLAARRLAAPVGCSSLCKAILVSIFHFSTQLIYSQRPPRTETAPLSRRRYIGHIKSRALTRDDQCAITPRVYIIETPIPPPFLATHATPPRVYPIMWFVIRTIEGPKAIYRDYVADPTRKQHESTNIPNDP